MLLKNTNIYWSSTPFEGDNGVDVNVNQAYFAAFSPFTGVGQDIFADGFTNNIDATVLRFFSYATLNPPLYVTTMPLFSHTKGAVRLVRDVTLTSGTSK